MNRRFFRYLSGGLIILCLGVFGFSSPSYADDDIDIVTKALFQGLSKCYDEAAFRSEVNILDVEKPDSILNAKGKISFINIPNGLVGDLKDTVNQIKCQDLIDGTLKFTTILPSWVEVPNAGSSFEARENFLAFMGYTANKNNNNKETRCFNIKYNVEIKEKGVIQENRIQRTHNICAVVNNDGKIDADQGITIVKDGDPTIIDYGYLKMDKTVVELFCNGKKPNSCSGTSHEITDKTWKDFQDEILTKIRINQSSFTRRDLEREYTYSLPSENDYDEFASNYFLNDNAKEIALENFTGSKNPDLKISYDETAELYVTYLIKFYGTDQRCGEFSEAEKSVFTNDGYVEYVDNADGNTCLVKATKNTDKSVNGVDDGYLNKPINFSEVVEFLKNYTGPININLDTADTIEPGQKTQIYTTSSCISKGGGRGLAWIICPVLEFMTESGKDIYDEYLSTSLDIKPVLFTEDDGVDGVRDAWETFRNIANIVFIILLLVVIFSQLTGHGIDNYGIKKILPKLIISAVLINASFYVCQICVDVSNIAGNAMQSLFDGLAEGFDEGKKPENRGSVTLYAVTKDGENKSEPVNDLNNTLTSAALLGGIFSVASVAMNPAILLTLLVSALGVIISFLFLFVLLAGRQAAVVVLMVISPLMFVLYMLPNTKKIFDKWLNMWKVLLLLYPICGLLVGGGNFVSRLMLETSDGNMAMAFTAMVVGILPIFFIPMYVQDAMSVLGKVGARLSGLGDRMGKGATGAIRSSEGYKATQARGYARKTRIQAGMDKEGNLTGIGKIKNKVASHAVGRFLGYDTLLAAKAETATKNIRGQETAEATLSGLAAKDEIATAKDIMAVDGNGDSIGQSLFKTKRDNYYAGKFLDAARTGDTRRINAAMQAMQNSGMSGSDIAKAVRHANNTGLLDMMGREKKSAWLQEQAKNNQAFAKDVEMQHWANGGGAVRLGDYGEYALDGHMDATDIDENSVAGAGSESIAGLIKAGLVNTGMAEAALEKGGLTPEKRIMLGAVKDGKINTTTLGSLPARSLKTDAKDLLAGNPLTNSLINATANDIANWTSPGAQRVTVV